jgi:hypothetical protein
LNEQLKNGDEHQPRAGERVSHDGRAGVLRYLYGNGAAVVRLDGDAGTKVVPLRRLVACSDERPLPDR